MRNSILLKGLVLGSVALCVCASILPSTVGIIEKKAVATDNNSRGYIQGLIDNASNGDTIYVPSGIYYENIIINKSISLIGEDRNTTIIHGIEGSYNVVGIAGASWVNISRFTIQNGHAGIELFGKNITISDNNILNCDKGIKSFGGSIHNNIINNHINNEYAGIEIISHYGICYGNYISNNTIKNNSFSGIYICSMKNSIANNMISNSDYAIWVEGNDNSISGNTISNNLEGYGIWLFGYQNNSIAHNTILNNYCGIEIVGSHNNSVINNTISNNNWVGIAVQSHDNVISNNTISMNRKGIHLHYSSENRITHNIISENELLGVLIDESHNNDIINNGISTNQEEGIYLIESNNNSITFNNISDNEDGIELEDSSYNLISKNIIDSNTDYGIEFHASSKDHCIHNKIKQNLIRSNTQGIYLNNSYKCTVLQNNFIMNQRPAMFENCTNIWRQNYWNRPRLFPKLIFGTMTLGNFTIPWINIDWHPALTPYDIG
jgi:parallel beta-helix repeat protein